MIIHKSYKFRIYPNNEQYGLIMQNIGSSRLVYNYFLKLKGLREAGTIRV